MEIFIYFHDVKLSSMKPQVCVIIIYHKLFNTWNHILQFFLQKYKMYFSNLKNDLNNDSQSNFGYRLRTPDVFLLSFQNERCHKNCNCNCRHYFQFNFVRPLFTNRCADPSSLFWTTLISPKTIKIKKIGKTLLQMFCQLIFTR